MFPRFNSTFRYTGTYTYHQARQVLLDRPNPDFERSLSKRTSRNLNVAESRQIILTKVNEVDETNETRLLSTTTIDSDQALLSAIRQATDLDPNKQSDALQM